jgi:hypothetical protein
LKVDTTPSDLTSRPKEEALCPLAKSAGSVSNDAPSSDLAVRPEEEACPLAKSTGSASSAWKTIAGKKEVRKDMKSTKNSGQGNRL